MSLVRHSKWENSTKTFFFKTFFNIELFLSFFCSHFMFSLPVCKSQKPIRSEIRRVSNYFYSIIKFAKSLKLLKRVRPAEVTKKKSPNETYVMDLKVP